MIAILLRVAKIHSFTTDTKQRQGEWRRRIFTLAQSELLPAPPGPSKNPPRPQGWDQCRARGLISLIKLHLSGWAVSRLNTQRLTEVVDSSAVKKFKTFNTDLFYARSCYNHWPNYEELIANGQDHGHTVMEEKV